MAAQLVEAYRGSELSFFEVCGLPGRDTANPTNQLMEGGRVVVQLNLDIFAAYSFDDFSHLEIHNRDQVHPFAIPGGKRSPVTKVWEKVIEGGEIQSIPIFEDKSQMHRIQT
jgi:hypothetical protein